MSDAFETILKDNPMFAKGLDLEKYVEEHLAGKASEEKAAPEKKEESEEEKESGEAEEGEEKKG